MEITVLRPLCTPLTKTVLRLVLLLALPQTVTGCASESGVGQATWDINPRKSNKKRTALSQEEMDEETSESGLRASMAGGAAPAPKAEPMPLDPFAPPDDNYAEDSVRCGNGVLDLDEICDVTIPDGERGACPKSCEYTDPCKATRLFVRACWTRCIPMMPAPEANCAQ